jgi:hypothetical protein
LWGRPTSDRESPYLLPGFAQCGICGASLYVRAGTPTRGIGRPKTRRVAYHCQVHRHRGPTVCANASMLPREATEAAVLDALNTSVLDPEVVEQALREAEATLREQARQRPEARPRDRPSSPNVIARSCD